MKVLIMGASGSGTSTLANEVSTRLQMKHLDVDDYYWEKTDPPFQNKIDPVLRKSHLLCDFNAIEDAVVSGSLISWGDEWVNAFDLVVFIQIDPKIRMQRLQDREKERYGTKLLTNKALQKQSKGFLDWASKYDDANFDGRSITLHNDWLAQLSCTILKIDGATPLKEKAEKVSKEVRRLEDKKTS